MKTMARARMIVPSLIFLACGFAVRAADAQASATAPTTCKDGTYSKSKQHSGTCSKHGGVDQWLDGSK
jgi:hypothetical protein